MGIHIAQAATALQDAEHTARVWQKCLSDQGPFDRLRTSGGSRAPAAAG